MWPSWTSDRKQRIPVPRVLSAERTVARRSDATHSDGGSTAPLSGPALGQDHNLLVLIQDPLLTLAQMVLMV